jgi:CRP-like cAMP-binding protein
LQLFFGNVALLTDTIKDKLKEKADEGDLPIVVIIDFTLVNGMDSSAAHAVAKLKKIIHRLFNVELSIFCTGSDRGGFPCEFALSAALSSTSEVEIDLDDSTKRASKILSARMDGRVCETLDDALQFAEDMLICRQDGDHDFLSLSCVLEESSSINMTLDEERYRAMAYLRNMFSDGLSTEFKESSARMIVSMMTREGYYESDIVWDHGADASSLKIVVSGELLSLVDETGASEIVKVGSIVGELGLVHGISRLTTLACSSKSAILYSLDIDSWRKLKEDHPKVASLIDGIVIRYLAHRVQHVSNRYFHTTLPV